MKMYRSLGVILALLAFIFCTNKYIDNKSKSTLSSFKEENGVLVADLSNDNKSSDGSYVTYTNTNSHPIILDQGNIELTCTGSGKNKDQDEALVKQNMNVTVLYSKDKDIKTKSIKILKDEMVYIYVSTSYSGVIYPENEVNCDYRINIQSTI